MKKLILGSLLAGLAVFVWGFVVWGTGVGNLAHETAPDEAAVLDALQTHLPESGMYYLPDPAGATTNPEGYAARHEAGPLVTVFIRKAGAPVMSPGLFLLGFLHMAATAFLIGLLLRAALPALGPTYGRRVMFVLLAGIAAAFWADFADPVWRYHPLDFHLVNFAYNVVAWGIAGAILARFVRPEAAPATPRAAAAPVPMEARL